MASLWTRTASEFVQREHFYRITDTVDSNGNEISGSQRSVAWPHSARVSANVERDHDTRKWKWIVFDGYMILKQGECTTESGAKAAVMRVIKPLIAERVRAYTPANLPPPTVRPDSEFEPSPPGRYPPRGVNVKKSEG